MMRTKTPRRYVVWTMNGQGRWRPTQAMTQDEATKMAAQLGREGRTFRVAPVPTLDPEED